MGRRRGCCPVFPTPAASIEARYRTGSRRVGRLLELEEIHEYLDFRSCAAADAQARWTALICSGVAWPGCSGRNRAAMMVRRSLAIMSSKDGSVLQAYQGWRVRRSVM